jgi:hypothetical protein
MQPFLKLVPAATMASAAPGLPPELALWLERALGAAGARRNASPGGWPGAAEEARDTVLRALAQRFYPFVPVSTQAARIHALAETYSFANWPRDRVHAQIPARYRNAPEEYLWAAFKSGAPMPLARRDLRRILIATQANEAW